VISGSSCWIDDGRIDQRDRKRLLKVSPQAGRVAFMLPNAHMGLSDQRLTDIEGRALGSVRHRDHHKARSIGQHCDLTKPGDQQVHKVLDLAGRAAAECAQVE
jgi:hypothetical protein